MAGALSLHTSMINETPPDDGHRRTTLSPDVTQLGVSVLLDPGTGTLWLTEDYARLRVPGPRPPGGRAPDQHRRRRPRPVP